ncbi:hypothetical protein [Pinibacter aurantiacus]|uniref:Uncharacterized protein n=1 Tax=Pinibacter aurantiacus TaxID=2851599 RepID=A0A9E2SAT0_9BACT|nr:hypothetical protein [Pinibacter aurantiacus]MBV4357877.1 hypothetical protein [Pinibacter aurantiacus]
MLSTSNIGSLKKPSLYSPSYQYGSSMDGTVEALQQNAYAKGRIDGAKDMQVELIKRGNALFQLAFQRASEITDLLVNAAAANNITIYDFHLKVEDWDNISSLIIVKLEDYVDDKIDLFYRAASEISDQYNDDAFHWDYMITYDSDALNTGKIFADGFKHLYEHTARPRKT